MTPTPSAQLRTCMTAKKFRKDWVVASAEHWAVLLRRYRHGAMIYRRGCPRLPREAAAERSRPHSQSGKGDAMAVTTLITVPQFSRLIGLPNTPDDRRCAHRRRLWRRSEVSASFAAARSPRHRQLGAGVSGQERNSRLPARAKIERRDGRMVEARGHRCTDARRRV